MSLDVSKLQNLRMRGEKTTARCPACREAGHDQKGEHLVLNADGSFGCVVHAGSSSAAKEHRKRIFALCGDRMVKPLIIHDAKQTLGSGRLGRPFQIHSESAPIKTGLLGRLGRAFPTHARRPPEIGTSGLSLLQQNDVERGVPAVPESQLRPNRALTECEVSILRRAGAEKDPVIITALNLFNATIVE